MSCNCRHSSWFDCCENFCNRPSYANFWQTEFITVPFGSPFSFNQSGPHSGGVFLSDPSTIGIDVAGDYRVSYILSINTSQNPVFPHIPVVALFLNNSSTPIPNTQTSFGVQIAAGSGCFQLVGEAIISIPARSSLQLKNNSIFNHQSIITCDNGINAASITLQRLS